MSIYACDVHGRRVPGSLETAYPSLLRGGVRYSRKLRLCIEHMDALLGSESPRLTAVSDDGEAIALRVCGTCGSELDSTQTADAVFVTVYRRKADRADYFAELCRACGDAQIGEWRLEP